MCCVVLATTGKWCYRLTGQQGIPSHDAVHSISASKSPTTSLSLESASVLGSNSVSPGWAFCFSNATSGCCCCLFAMLCVVVWSLLLFRYHTDYCCLVAIVVVWLSSLIRCRLYLIW